MGLIPVSMSGAGGRAEHRARGKWTPRHVRLACCQVAPVQYPENDSKTGPAGCLMNWPTTAGRQPSKAGAMCPATRQAAYGTGAGHAAIMQGWHRWHQLCARAGPGGMWAAHLCCCRVCCTIHLLDILQLAQEVLGWQSGRQRTILPSLVEGTPVALQHRQKHPFRCLEMTAMQELALWRGT